MKYQVMQKTKELSFFIISKEMKDDFKGLISLLEELRGVASKQTHYHNLDEWSTLVYDYIYNMLKKYNFKNGDMETNNKNPKALFWWEVYYVFSSIIYSPNLKSKVANHHSSAYERNEAFIKELQWVYEKITL